MPLIHRTLSPRALEARRLNARRSTGPRTERGKQQAALNLLHRGAYSRRLARTLRALGESPKEYRRLLAGLVESHQPATASEAMLVEELAALRWQRRRCERAQAALLAQNRADARQELLRRAVERRRRTWSVAKDAPGDGLRCAPDSHSKFSQLADLLSQLGDRFGEGDVSDQTRAMLQAVFGDHPTARGASIVKLFAEVAPPGPTTPLREATLGGLHLAVLEEANDVALEYEAYRSEIADPPPAAYDASLAPSGEAWRQLLRQQAALDRHIERKIRLLIRMQNHRREEKRREPSERQTR